MSKPGDKGHAAADKAKAVSIQDMLSSPGWAWLSGLASEAEADILKILRSTSPGDGHGAAQIAQAQGRLQAFEWFRQTPANTVAAILKNLEDES